MITMVFGLVATFLCDKFSKEAEGSGIPQIKTFLSGLKLNNYLNARSYFVKMAGLILVDGGGFFTGKEGPLIRLSAMIARKIMEFSYFSKISKNSFLRNQMMIVSVAAGVVSTFGASYGGLMFAIEICTTTFLIANLWRAFVCATIVKILYTYINSSDGLDIFVDLQNVDLLSSSMLTHSVMLGLLGGWLGSLWIYTFCKLQRLKEWSRLLSNRYLWMALVGLVISLINFKLPTSYIGGKTLLKSLFYEKNLMDLNLGDSGRADIYFTLLFLSFLSRYVITLLFASSPIPNGIFLPSLVIGALFGRLYGEFVAIDNPGNDPRIFAMIGAASFASSITRTTSTVLVICEITENSTIIVGLLIGVTVAYSTSNLFTKSFFDTVLALKKLPYLPILFRSDIYKLKAKQVCH